MKRRTKAVTMALGLLLCVGLLFGCGTPKDENGTNGTVNKTATEVLDAVLADATDVKDSLIDVPGEMMQDFFASIKDTEIDSAVRMSSMNVKSNEIGIFKVSDDTEAETVKAAIDKRMQQAISGWMPGYMPEEIEKMENYTVKHTGNYIIYVVADEPQKEIILKAFEKEVQK